jgi:3-deoxy-D-manno-octulosonic-acid transferase
MYYWYKLLTYLFYPFAVFFLLIRKLKKKEHITRYTEKLAKIKIKRDEGFLIWFHVASVGEGLSILPLVENFAENNKVKKILITSVTLSSAEVLQKKLIKNKKVAHQFLPFDIPIFVNKFLKHWSPNVAIFVDSEVWPNFVFEIKKKKIPLILLNGRITKKSFTRWNYINKHSRKIFEKFDLCLAASKESENYLKILGANNIKNYGNIKFTNTRLNSFKELDLSFLKKIESRKIWCAASTHASEEIFCGKVHLRLKEKYKDILTIIIPRHINRINNINKELSDLGLKVIRYSRFNDLSINTDILLVDTYGDAPKFFNLTSGVFLGGSLIAHGGQNPIEPSRLGCKIFHGTNIGNFTEIYDYLKTLGVTKRVNNVQELNQSLVENFSINNINNNEILKKIDNFGKNILNNVMQEINKYVNS